MVETYKKECNLIINYFQIIFYYDGENNMKSSVNSNIIILIVLGILFAFSPISTSNFLFYAGNNKTSSEYDDDNTLDYENLKISATSGKIHIDGNSEWIAFKNAGKCTGEGTYSDPYIIEDLVIDGGGSGSCIEIENSDVYFIIKNCFVYNSGGSYDWTDAGIHLSIVNNALIISNNCSSNAFGISLTGCNNNTISGNTAYDNTYHGILLDYSDYNTISGNTAYDNRNGIYLSCSNKNTISGNIMNKCGLGLYGSIEELGSHNIDTTNLVNGKPLYYYSNEANLEPNNFTNAGQVILVNCKDSLISNLNASYCSTGISLFYCNNNIISGNIASYNRVGGIFLAYSDYNNITGNTANNNFNGIYLYFSDYNTISGNTANNHYRGIYLNDSSYNTISGNTANYNKDGMFLCDYSDYNTVSGNILLENDECIVEENCQGNEFSDNGSCTYGQADGGIPIELIILISSISGGAVIGVATLLLIRRKRKKIE